jgi:nucleotide-binding universal stress UspA family protein
MSQKKILVPVNFDRVAEVCVNHAYSIAKRIGAEIHLLHLVDKVEDLEDARKKLASFAEERKVVEGKDVTFHQSVRVGDILKTIGMQAEEMEATLVVMGTHGLQGLEYIVGTHAVRIVGTANVPFIIVQEKEISKNGYENIIVPIELESEAKQKLGLVAQMAEAFDSKVHLITPFEKDEHLRNAQQRNLTYAEGFFKNQGITSTSTIAAEENDDLDEAAFQLVEEKQGDLIAIMNWHSTRIIGGIGSDDTQDIIINKDMVPVLIINPKMIGNFELFRTTV